MKVAGIQETESQRQSVKLRPVTYERAVHHAGAETREGHSPALLRKGRSVLPVNLTTRFESRCGASYHVYQHFSARLDGQSPSERFSKSRENWTKELDVP